MGPVRYGGGLFTPAVFYLLVANVVLFAIRLFAPTFAIGWLALIPNQFLFRVQLWRVVSYLFIHGDFAHLFFNMIALFFFGPALERSLGYNRFFKFYFLCGVGAGIFSVLFYKLLGQGGAIIIGASGAIFGVLAGYALFFPNSTVYLNFILPIKAKYMVLIFALMELFATVQYAGGGRSGIASIAHISGMAIAYFYLRGRGDFRKLRFRYKYWRAERERRKHFKVYKSQDQDRYH